MRPSAILLITCLFCTASRAADPFQVDLRPRSARLTALHKGYRAFLEAVRSEDPAKIRDALATPPRGGDALQQLVIDQLLTFRRFDRIAHEKLGGAAGNLGFGLDDASIDYRIKVLAEARVNGTHLYLPGRDDSNNTSLASASLVAMTPEDDTWKPDATFTFGPSPDAYIRSTYRSGGPPGPQKLAIYRKATRELENGNLTTRAQLDAFLEHALVELDRNFDRAADGVLTPAPQAETDQARAAVRKWLETLKAGDVEAARKLTVNDEPDDHGAIDRAVRQAVVHLRIKDAIRTFDFPGFDVGTANIDHSLHRLSTAVLRTTNQGDHEIGFLHAADYDRVVATTRPLVQAGFTGAPPEDFVMLKSGGAWKVALFTLTRMPAEAYMKEQAARGEDVRLRAYTDLLKKFDGKDADSETKLIVALMKVEQDVIAAADKHRTEAEKAMNKRRDDWRASKEGQAALKQITSPDSRLQLRLVLDKDAPGEFDEIADPSSKEKLHVSKEVLLNEKAFASASIADDDQTHRPTVRATLTEAGGKQMEWVTSRNINHRLAIVFDKKLVMAPTIRSTIGKALVIDGGRDGFSKGEAERLVAAIRGEK